MYLQCHTLWFYWFLSCTFGILSSIWQLYYIVFVLRFHCMLIYVFSLVRFRMVYFLFSIVLLKLQNCHRILAIGSTNETPRHLFSCTILIRFLLFFSIFCSLSLNESIPKIYIHSVYYTHIFLGIINRFT